MHDETLSHRQQQIGYVAELTVIAFHGSHGLGTIRFPEARQAAINACARIRLTDESGTDLDSVREIASATLCGQDFRPSAVSLFLDDVLHDATALAREQRAAVGV